MTELDESEYSSELRISLNQTALINTLSSSKNINSTKKHKQNIALLKNISSRSKIKTKLAHILAIFHTYPLIFILTKFFLGLLFIALPIYLMVYLNLIENKIIPLFIIIVISFVCSLSLIIIRIIDDNKNNLSSFAKWQRNNILTNFGLSINLLILILPTYYLFNFYKELKFEFDKHIENNDLKLNYFNNLIFDLFYFTHNKRNNNIINKNDKSAININNIIKDNLFCISIPMLIFCWIKIMKIVLIKLKYCVEQFIFYLSGILFFVLTILLYRKKIENQIISLIQFIIIILFLFIYDIWIIHSVIQKLINKQDKTFCIKNYKKIHLILIFFFDFLLLSGTSMILNGFILYYIKYYNYINNDKIIDNIDMILFFFRLGFICDVVAFCYYYGRYLMKIVFKPISYEFVPSELKDENYIKIDYENNIFFEILKSHFFKKSKVKKK